MKKRKNMVWAVLFAICFLGFSLFTWAKPADSFSDSERRELKQFPKLSVETLLNGNFMSNFESYALDQFPLRDGLRSIKSAIARNVFGHKDVNDLYLEDGYIVSMEYPMNEESLDWAADRFEKVYEQYFQDSDVNMYISIIPDKNYFLGKESGHLVIDYEVFIKQMTDKVPYMNYIDIAEQLTIEDYYKTDSHWKQPELLGVVETLGEGMGVTLQDNYDKVTLETPFYGVYYGQLAANTEADIIEYLDNQMLQDCVIYDFQNEKEIPMYDLKKATGKDPYELFLGGPLSLVTIENPNAETDKELLLFRDSFGSSIAPLLAEGYAKITLIDIRYMQSALLEKYITVTDQDVLFLYSTSVLNNSSTLK